MENYNKITRKNNKKWWIIGAVVLAIVLVIVFTIISIKKTDEEKMIEEAIVKLESFWKSDYEKDNIEDKYFEIKNTRVIKIKENDIEELKNVEYIIDFAIYSNYFLTTPYYTETNKNNNIVVYKDGSTKIESDILWNLRSNLFIMDFSKIVDSITDYHDDFNCIKNLK